MRDFGRGECSLGGESGSHTFEQAVRKTAGVEAFHEQMGFFILSDFADFYEPPERKVWDFELELSHDLFDNLIALSIDA